jgi:hypothetical protein
MMLLEEGFEVVSVDASDKMLKQAYKQRWDHRKEDIYDKWSKNKKKAFAILESPRIYSWIMVTILDI